MFNRTFIADVVDRSSESALDRRRMLTLTGLAGAGAATAVVAGGAASASATPAPSDATVLNFALNLEYLEAEFYLRATTGEGLPDSYTHGKGQRGPVRGGREVKFQSRAIRRIAEEIAGDERAHVGFLRDNLKGAAVARPAISLDAAFAAAAKAAGLGKGFDPYANELNFLLAAFVFEDVGVTAYKGASPLISNKGYLEAAAGILAVEAYHAGTIRSTLYNRGLANSAVFDAVQKLSDACDALDNRQDDDQGIRKGSRANIQPTDKNSIAYSRSPQDVLNVVYLNSGAVSKGGFFPNGVNGDVRTSSAL